jgi:hypothetical protein
LESHTIAGLNSANIGIKLVLEHAPWIPCIAHGAPTSFDFSILHGG